MAWWKRRPTRSPELEFAASGQLSPLRSQGKSGDRLFLWSSPEGQRLVKVYTGRAAQSRRDLAEAALRLWSDEGYPVPRPHLLAAPGIQAPHLVREYIEGPTLSAYLRDPQPSREQKIAQVERVLVLMRTRHERALAEGDCRWLHPDANTGNIILATDGPIWIDLERLVQGVAPLEAASAELVKLARRVHEDLGQPYLTAVSRQVLDLYRGLEQIPRLFCQRTFQRPWQPLHRWRDRRRGAARPGAPTKYDLADLWRTELLTREDSA